MKTYLAEMHLWILIGVLTLFGAEPPVSAAPAKKKLAVAVLYFDNNSNNREYDVLQKGLADMLITDLAVVDTLQVVERDRIKSLLDEISLQRGRFFDPKTAQKLGHGIGASYVVTGALAALEPQIRIDIRLIEVSTGSILVTDKVIGTKTQFFALEEQLVSRFLAGLNVKLTKPKLSGVNDVSTLLQYSQGLDSADKGNLQAASTQLAAAARSSPGSSMVQGRYAEIQARLQQAQANRHLIFTRAEQYLLNQIDTHLRGKNIMKLSDSNLARYLSYRLFRYYFFRWKLLKILVGTNSTDRCKNCIPFSNTNGLIIIPKSKRDEALQLMKIIVNNHLNFLEEVRSRLPDYPTIAHDQIHVGVLLKDLEFNEELESDGNGGFITVLVVENYIQKDELQAAQDLGIVFDRRVVFPCKNFLYDIIDFAAFGDTSHTIIERANEAGCVPDVFPNFNCNREPKVFPSILQMEPQFMSTISALFKKEAARFPRSPENQDYFIYKLDHEARIFLSMGRKEDALKKWQEILDKFPRSPRFEEFETKIKEYLGTSDEQKDLNEAAKSCQFDKYYDKYIEINKFKPGNHNLIANIALRVLNWEGSAGVLSFYEKTKNCNKINKKDSDRTYQPKAFFSRALEEEFQKGSCSLYETLSKQKKKIINLKTWRLATPNCLAICEK